MSLGPVEYLEVAFPGNQFKGEILPALQDLVDRDVIKIIDLVIVTKNAAGAVTALEWNELPGDIAARLKPLHVQGLDLLNLQDITLLASDLENNSTAALLVFENLWAAKFAGAVRNAGGVVLENARVPHDVVMAAIEAAKAGA